MGTKKLKMLEEVQKPPRVIESGEKEPDSIMPYVQTVHNQSIRIGGSRGSICDGEIWGSE